MTSEGGNLQKAEAGAFGAHTKTASANFTVGEIGFGPAWSAEDSLAAANVQLHYRLEEANARVAVLEEEQKILQRTIESLRYTACEESCRDKEAADRAGGNPWSNR